MAVTNAVLPPFMDMAVSAKKSMKKTRLVGLVFLLDFSEAKSGFSYLDTYRNNSRLKTTLEALIQLV